VANDLSNIFASSCLALLYVPWLLKTFSCVNDGRTDTFLNTNPKILIKIPLTVITLLIPLKYYNTRIILRRAVPVLFLI
jgi:hypothetical protein